MLFFPEKVPVTSVLTIKSQQCTDKESQPESTTGTFLSDKTHTAGCLLSLHHDFIDCGPLLAATKEIDATASPPSVHHSPLLTPYLLNFHCEHYVIRGHEGPVLNVRVCCM